MYSNLLQWLYVPTAHPWAGNSVVYAGLRRSHLVSHSGRQQPSQWLQLTKGIHMLLRFKIYIHLNEVNYLRRTLL